MDSFLKDFRPSVYAVRSLPSIMPSCPPGAFPTIRHYEIRDLTGTLLTEVCHDVSLKPVLQPLTGEVLNHATSNHDAEAHVDVAARDI